jgi:hypothetical protein
MKKLTLLLTFVFVLGFAGMAMAADNDDITLDFTVPLVNELQVTQQTSGNLSGGTNLTFVVGATYFTTEEATDIQYSYSSNYSSSNITAELDHAMGASDGSNTLNGTMSLKVTDPNTGALPASYTDISTGTVPVVSGITPVSASALEINLELKEVPITNDQANFVRNVTLTITNP